MVSHTTDLSSILLRTLQDISRRVAELDLVPSVDFTTESTDSSSLRATACGEYRLTLVLTAQNTVLREITRKMKHQTSVLDTDIPIYTTEYYNIFCGHVVSELNRMLHTRARFGIPSFGRECPVSNGEQTFENDMYRDHAQLYFHSSHGSMKLEALYDH